MWPTRYVSVYPNAGLPNEMGEYDESPEFMAGMLEELGARRPDQHRRRLLRHDAGPYPRHRRAVSKYKPRHVPEVSHKLRLSGLEPFVHG